MVVVSDCYSLDSAHFMTYLWVCLSTIVLARTVESNDLVAENIATRSDGRRNRNVPGEPVAHHLVGRPGAWWRGAVNQTLLVDLEELQGARGGGGAGPVALGEVVEDGAVMRFGPCLFGMCQCMLAEASCCKLTFQVSDTVDPAVTAISVVPAVADLWQAMSSVPKDFGSTKPT